MDSPLLILLSLGVFFGFFASFVISQQNVNPKTTPSPPPPVSPPPPPPVFSPPPPPPPPRKSPPPPPPPRHHHRTSPPRTKIHHRRRPPPPPPPPKDKGKAGLIVGVVFLVIAFLMQIGAVTYLLIMRRQLLKG